MPYVLPPGPPATAGGPPQPHAMAKQLQAWVKGALKPIASAVFLIG